MQPKLLHHNHYCISIPHSQIPIMAVVDLKHQLRNLRKSSILPTLSLKNCSSSSSSSRRFLKISAILEPLDLTEENVKQVLIDARTKFGQIFDTEVGMTGVVELVELDGPFVKISLRGRFWHERSLVLARLGNYMKQRIPEILEVEIEDEKQLDDSPENF